jgi:hypothetical protein
MIGRAFIEVRAVIGSDGAVVTIIGVERVGAAVRIPVRECHVEHPTGGLVEIGVWRVQLGFGRIIGRHGDRHGVGSRQAPVVGDRQRELQSVF